MKKVTLVINTLGSGGAQRQIVLLARELAAEHAVRVSVIHWGDTHMEHMLNGSGVEIIRLEQPLGVLGKCTLFVRLISTVNALNASHLVSFIDRPNMLCGLISMLRPRLVWIPSERNLVQVKSLRELMWRSILYWRAKAVVSNSESQKAWLVENLRVCRNKTHLIWNGVPKEFLRDDPVAFNLRNRGSRSLVVLARYADQKNPWLLLDALEVLANKSMDGLSVRWFGEDDPGCPGLRSKLVQMASEKNLPIEFFGPVENTANVVDAADGVLLCSKYEGTPNAVIEAMAARRLVIASAVSDVPVIIGKGDRGLLFESESVDGLVNSLEVFLSMSSDRARDITDRAYQFVIENFSSSSMANKFIKLI